MMLIRARQPEDLDGCVAVLRRVYATTGYPSGWPRDPARWLSPADQVAAWVAEDDGLLAGHIALVQGVRTECLLRAAGRDASELGGIARLFVDPAAMRRGLARALLAAAVGHARARGLQPVLDVVDDDEAAIALYEASGWKLAGITTATWVTPAGIAPTLRCYVASPAPDISLADPS
jgi:GNAT superfamily N-acetyltransferase